MAMIYKMTKEAWENEMDWDTALAKGEIETVEEFDTYEEAEYAYNYIYDGEGVNFGKYGIA